MVSCKLEDGRNTSEMISADRSTANAYKSANIQHGGDYVPSTKDQSVLCPRATIKLSSARESKYNNCAG